MYKIELNPSGVSSNGVSNLVIQIDDAGGIEASRYLGTISNNAAAISPANATDSIDLYTLVTKNGQN